MGSPKGSRLWTREFVTGTVLNFIISCNYFMLIVVMTAHAMGDYGAPASIAALTGSIFIIGTLTARVFNTVLVERLGIKRLLTAVMVCEVAFTACYLISLPLPGLMALRFVHGAAFGFAATCIATIVTGIVPDDRKGEGIGYFMLSITLGSAIGPFLGMNLSSAFGYPALFAVALGLVVLGIPCTLALNLFTSSRAAGKDPIPAEKAAEALEAGEIVGAPREEAKEDLVAACDEAMADNPRRFAKSAAAERKRRRHGKTEGTPRGQRASLAATKNSPSLRVPTTKLEARITEKLAGKAVEKFLEIPVLPVSIMASCIFFAYSSLLTFLTPYADQIGLQRAASLFFIVYAASMFVTRPFTGRAFDRHGPRCVVVPACIAFACGMALLAVARADWMMLAAAALCGFGLGTVQSSGLAMAVQVTPDERLSLANATFYIMLDTSVGLAPLFLGLAVPYCGYAALYGAMAAMGLLALALFFIVTRKPKGADKHQRP